MCLPLQFAVSLRDSDRSEVLFLADAAAALLLVERAPIFWVHANLLGVCNSGR